MNRLESSDRSQNLYCPHCGVNNDRNEAKCFVCEKPMPNFDAPATPAGRKRAEAARRDTAQLTMASVGDRAIALIFDRVLIASIVLVVTAWATDANYNFSTPLWKGLAVGGTFVLATFLYHFIMEAAFLTTVGKAAMGLHVGVEDGRNRAAAVALRNVLRIIDGLGMYLVGFLFATFSLKRQRVGDRIGSTVVVEWPIARGGRAAVMFLLIAIAVAAVWISNAVCPTCQTRLTQQLPFSAAASRPQ